MCLEHFLIGCGVAYVYLPVSYRIIATANTLTMQFIVRFSHLTVQVPSVVVSQKHELAVWRPAPLLCITAQVTP